jgi:hypothetical protein
MFKRLKKTLVESYVGAIGLGWLFAQGILHFLRGGQLPRQVSCSKMQCSN